MDRWLKMLKIAANARVYDQLRDSKSFVDQIAQGNQKN
jgi:hypothetical protein